MGVVELGATSANGAVAVSDSDVAKNSADGATSSNNNNDDITTISDSTTSNNDAGAGSAWIPAIPRNSSRNPEGGAGKKDDLEVMAINAVTSATAALTVALLAMWWLSTSWSSRTGYGRNGSTITSLSTATVVRDTRGSVVRVGGDVIVTPYNKSLGSGFTHQLYNLYDYVALAHPAGPPEAGITVRFESSVGPTPDSSSASSTGPLRQGFPMFIYSDEPDWDDWSVWTLESPSVWRPGRRRCVFLNNRRLSRARFVVEEAYSGKYAYVLKVCPNAGDVDNAHFDPNDCQPIVDYKWGRTHWACLAQPGEPPLVVSFTNPHPPH